MGGLVVKVKGLHIVKAKGRTYRYAWRGGPRIHAEPGTDEFIAELAAIRQQRIGGEKGKLTALLASYRASRAFKDMAPSTRKEWARWLDRIQERFGDRALMAFDHPKAAPAIRKWRDEFAHAPRSADVALEVFSRLLSYGRSEGMLSGDPVKAIPRLYRANRSMLIWTSTDFAELESRSSPEVYRAARLAALTGLRRGDLLRLAWTHIKPLSIEIPTGKSGGRKTTLIPIYGELRGLLDTIPKRAVTVLTTSKGVPWGTGFGASWNAAVRADKSAGRERIALHFHDLRGTAATRFFVAGLSVRQIAQIMTWSEEFVGALIDRYVKRDEIILDMIRRIDGGTPGEQETAKPL